MTEVSCFYHHTPNQGQPRGRGGQNRPCCAKASEKYKASAEFVAPLSASSYFRGENPTIDTQEPSSAPVKSRRAGNRRPPPLSATGNGKTSSAYRIGSSCFLFRFVHAGQKPVSGSPKAFHWPVGNTKKKRHGADFDHLLSRYGRMRPCCTGVSYGYRNADHLEISEMARAAGSGFLPLAGTSMTVRTHAGRAVSGSLAQITPDVPAPVRAGTA